MALLENLTAQSWMDDMQFVLGTMLRQEPEEEKQAWVEDYLRNRYVPIWILPTKESLRFSYNFLARNWGYFGEVGLRTKTGIMNCVLFAVYNRIFGNPNYESWKKIPEIDPREIVSEAQKFIDAEKK